MNRPHARARRAVLGAFHALPLRRRLSMLIAVCAGFTTLLCLLAVLGSGLWLQQTSAREETTEVARTLSFALQAPVAFGDRRGMSDALTLLRARPQVESAFVYDLQGKLLGGRAMQIVYSDKQLRGFMQAALDVSPEHPVLVDKFLDGAIEVDVDAICDFSAEDRSVGQCVVAVHCPGQSRRLPQR